MTAPFAARTDLLTAATDAARWIRSTAVATPHGLTWRPDPDHPERDATISAPGTLYSGGAGIVLFFLELARATGDTTYLEDARRGADHLAATWRDTLGRPSLVDLPNVQLDFQMGIGGTAFVLGHAWRATGDPAHREAALAILRRLVDAARPAGAGIDWIGAPSVGLGDGGIVLTLLWGARFFGEPAFRETAIAAGRRILELAEPDPRGGLRWRHPLMARVLGIEGLYMPNFELGTAGVAFVLAASPPRPASAPSWMPPAPAPSTSGPSPPSRTTRRCSSTASPT